jgi:hypothetical protein
MPGIEDMNFGIGDERLDEIADLTRRFLASRCIGAPRLVALIATWG